VSTIEDYRAQIRELDRRLLGIVKERLGLGSKLAQVKEAKGLPTVDADAELTTMSNLTGSAKNLGIEIEFARKLGELLIEQTVGVQNAIRPKQSRDQIMKAIFELTQKLISEGKEVTRFEIGEPNFPPFRFAVRELTASFKEKRIIGYGPSAGIPELRKALASELSASHHRKIDPDQILITPGGRFGIFATISSFVSEFQRVVIPQPAWPAYEECVDFVKGRTILVPTTLEHDWEIDVDRLEDELKKGVRMLIVNSPSNPTGKIITAKRFHEIVELARKYETLVLSDEVYEKFTHSRTPSILEEEYENSIYINSFSKQFGLTGWRIAYLVTSKQMALKIRRLIQTAVTCVPEFIQRAGLVELQKGRREAQRHVRGIMKKVDLTCNELSKINVSFYKPEGSFYVFPRANKRGFDSIKFAKQLLQQRLISITPGQSFGEFPEFFRLAVSLPENKIPDAVRTIGQAIDSWP
jgi:aspartate aminotransferase